LEKLTSWKNNSAVPSHHRFRKAIKQTKSEERNDVWVVVYDHPAAAETKGISKYFMRIF
jgi:hypothetical protein